jgi:hypothetical protein
MGALLATEGGPKPKRRFTLGEKVPAAEQGKVMQDPLRTYRQILYDLAVKHLEPLPGNFSRLAYLAALRNPSTGLYEEKELLAAYGREPVHQALSQCHEELFERVLELPLAQQQQDLAQCLETQPEARRKNQIVRNEFLESWIPAQAPEYLKELFRSNLNALFELLREQRPRARSGT